MSACTYYEINWLIDWFRNPLDMVFMCYSWYLVIVFIYYIKTLFKESILASNLFSQWYFSQRWVFSQNVEKFYHRIWRVCSKNVEGFVQRMLKGLFKECWRVCSKNVEGFVQRMLKGLLTECDTSLVSSYFGCHFWGRKWSLFTGHLISLPFRNTYPLHISIPEFVNLMIMFTV